MSAYPLPITPHCQCGEHHDGEQRPDAQVRLDFHGCRQVAACRSCAKGLFDPLNEAIAVGGVLQCGACGHVFVAVADFVTEGAL